MNNTENSVERNPPVHQLPDDPNQKDSPIYHKPGHLSALLMLYGKEIPMSHSPYIAVLNVPLKDHVGQTTCLHEILWDSAMRQQKIPTSLREILMSYTDASIAQMAPVQLPFITDAQGSLAVECFWGRKRCIAYVDPNVPESYTFKNIPVLSDDPENYIRSVMGND